MLGSGTNRVTVSEVERITGQDGNDTVVLTRGASDVVIDLGGGIDTVLLGPGANAVTLIGVESVVGGAGSDQVTLSGAGGTASVSLGAGYDVLTLGDGGLRVIASGVEKIRGGAGDDEITLAAGSAGAVIEGGDGDDTLVGADGADQIFGGAGRDHLVGGRSADLFMYTAIAQSSAAAPDTIVSFNAQEGDMLAFVGMGSGFRWRGALPFTAAGGAEGRFDEATTTLRIDFNGDGEAEMAFHLPGLPSTGFDPHSIIWA
nr:M10 family metallopeptidase C-terminal domain-containing protein [Neoroseomonas soli]